MNKPRIGTDTGQIAVNKTGQSCSIPHKNRRIFKGRTQAHSVRDEGVAGSNPATPTSFINIAICHAARYAERNPVGLADRRFVVETSR
jgi:hypothetical protein